MKCITGKYGIWLLAIGCWMLAACSSDDDEKQTGKPLYVASFTAGYQDSDLQTRAVPSGFTQFTPSHDMAFGIFVVPDEDPQDEDYTAKLIRWSNGVWHSQATVEGEENYTIFGFMPKESISSTLTPQTNGDYQMVLSGISAVSADDVCVIVGVHENADNLVQGQFKYRGKSDNNYLNLLMDHLYGAVRFAFLVDAEYSTLRSIKLKSLMLTTTKATATATVTLRPNTAGDDPIVGDVTYTTAGTSSSATFFESLEGMALSSDAISSFTCCFAPDVRNALTLVSTYDVYDKNGNKIRENCTATNKLPALTALRGERVTLTLTITPTYLYMLSDPDLDNPTVNVN